MRRTESAIRTSTRPAQLLSRPDDPTPPAGGDSIYSPPDAGCPGTAQRVIVFVDNEHPSGYAGEWGQMIRANRTRIKYELEDHAGQPCLMVRWSHVSPELLADLDVAGVFISGNSASADVYDSTEQDGLRRVITSRRWPIFGFCGGHQVMGQMLGAPLQPIGELEDGAEPFGEGADFAPGMKHELGYFPVHIEGTHPLLKGLGPDPVFRHAHAWELKSLPDGFTNYATTDLTQVQLMVNDDSYFVGAQFHPEYATDEYPAGRVLIENFMDWAGIR